MVKTLVFIFFIVCICSCNKTSEKHKELPPPSGTNYEYTDKANKKLDCIEPHNPYNDGGGHDAGFNWAAENGGACEGNSDSFNEGCEEFHRQLDEYNRCLEMQKK